MMMEYSLTQDAKSDLWRIYCYGRKRWGKDRAELYYYKFFEQFAKIAKNPRLYPEVTHINNNYRRAICGSDNIYYHIKGEKIKIITIVGRQEIGNKSI